MSGTRRIVTHAIADISFTDDGSFMFCGCGWDESAATPERLYAAFQKHRDAVGAPRRSSVDLLSDGEQRDFVINENSQRRKSSWRKADAAKRAVA